MHEPPHASGSIRASMAASSSPRCRDGTRGCTMFEVIFLLAFVAGCAITALLAPRVVLWGTAFTLGRAVGGAILGLVRALAGPPTGAV
jgi:hypothetical protein